jgi:hypothetical protein
MVLIDFGNSRELEEAMQMAVDLLAKYCHAKNVELSITD